MDVARLLGTLIVILDRHGLTLLSSPTRTLLGPLA